ncbi:cytochrome P450 [Phaeobacter gallaeciensis]|uniref:Cytochrome P450 n=2 Tax=Roseobacteraceae TaxID=2854170 RepID=A0A366WLY6_9RHOB|nr:MULTISPECIES: cytochrome P450 [Roseobacteraceae]MBT3140103.1 cytochrome P450 [Falsiruegeria litorea]RBW50396.1 cytochrome P450 [Phaeobacter gallaeciensis]
MSDAMVYEIDPQVFWRDPYPDLKRMRAMAPVVFVPQLGATLIVRRQDIFEQEKKTEVFSSDQPGGLMTVLMGQNMMRKDGADHLAERKAIFSTVSPKTVQRVWTDQFRAATEQVLAGLKGQGRCDLVRDYALPVSAEALKAMTGLTQMSAVEMDRVSQGMIDGCANYAGDPEVEARCHDCTASIDRHIDEMIPFVDAAPDQSLLSVQRQAGMEDAQVRANIKLAISGGQNEPRDAIAGTVWALLQNPDQLELVRAGRAAWRQAFEEYARWMSPIGMSPRRVAQKYELHGVTLKPEERVFLMFGSGNRDEAVFARPDAFDLTQDITAAISFGAGPHFCAGAWAAKALIGDVALPMLFERFSDLRLDGAAEFGGWAFRGPLQMPVRWD